MAIETGYKAFDRAANGQTGCVTTGNVISANQYSCHLRAWNDTECNGFHFAPGVLQEHDLAVIKASYPGVYRKLKAYLDTPDNHFKTQSGWVYVIRHFEKKLPVVHGVLVTSAKHKLLVRFRREDVMPCSRPSFKADTVMNHMAELLAA